MSLEGKRFLLIMNDMSWFWSHRLPLARDIMAAGAELHLATNDAENNPSITALGITGHSLSKQTGIFNPFKQMSLCAQMFTTMRFINPDIIHVFTIRHAFFAGIASRLSDMPRIVFTVAGTGSLFTSDKPKIKIIRALAIPLLRFALGGKGRFVIFKTLMTRVFSPRAGIVRKEACGVIRGSGVDPDQFPYTPEIISDVPIVLFASRLLKSKGIGEFVHAARILKSKGISARFIVAGDVVSENHESLTRADINGWAQEGAIEWLGQQDSMPTVLQNASVVCLPSYYGEGVPKILLEAASTGRAIVTTDMPGCREAVENGQTGLLVPPKDAWALAEALEKLIADPALRQSMGEKGRARVEANFTAAIVNARTLSVYRKLLAA